MEAEGVVLLLLIVCLVFVDDFSVNSAEEF